MSLRVLHVIETCGAGGMETTFLNVLRCWAEAPAWASHDVLATAGGVLAPRIEAVAHRLWITADPADIRQRLTAGYDVVHVLFERQAVEWIPYVVTHAPAAVVYGKGYDMGGTFRLNDGLRWQPDASVMWGSERVTFTTPQLAAGYDVAPSRQSVLGKAAAVGRFMTVPAPAADTPDRIVCVANLHALKRLGDLVHAVARLAVDCPGVRVRFVGADVTGERSRLMALASQLGIARRCEFTGRHDDVAVDLAESRVFALPSGREGVPTAMLEAMAAARPVVVTNVGHVDSVVRDGMEGYLVPVGDILTLTARLRAILLDRSLATTLGLAARQRAAAHDVTAVAARLRDTLLAARHAPAHHGAAA